MKRKREMHTYHTKWTPFFRCTFWKDGTGAQIQIPDDIVVLRNNIFTVTLEGCDVPPPMGPVAWLSIKRNDRQTIHDWRELQRIKNMIMGEECEAVEIYPAESRVHDTANQYHCWVFAPGYKLPKSERVGTRGPIPRPIGARLWSKVDLSGGPDGCWEFQGSRNEKGYGKIAQVGDSNGKSPWYAHRLAYAMANGVEYEDLPDGYEVMHSCDNPPCCNPSHLSLGTSQDNKHDQIAKGRMWWQSAQRDAQGRVTKTTNAEMLDGGFNKEIIEAAQSGVYHLECFAPGYQLPFGYMGRFIADEKNTPGTIGGNAKQRPFSEDDKPADCISGTELSERFGADPTLGSKLVHRRMKLG